MHMPMAMPVYLITRSLPVTSNQTQHASIALRGLLGKLTARIFLNYFIHTEFPRLINY